MLLGDVPSTLDPTYKEIALSYGSGTVGLPGTSTTFTIATFAMPFTGSLAVKLMASVGWGASYQNINLSVHAASTPVADDGLQNSLAQDNKGVGTNRTIPTLAWWSSIPAATVVTIIATLGNASGGGAFGLTLNSMYGYARMCSE